MLILASSPSVTTVDSFACKSFSGNKSTLYVLSNVDPVTVIVQFGAEPPNV